MMKSSRISSRQEYDQVMVKIESLLQKSKLGGGFDSLSEPEAKTVEQLSLQAEQYEDSVSLMPMV